MNSVACAGEGPGATALGERPASESAWVPGTRTEGTSSRAPGEGPHLHSSWREDIIGVTATRLPSGNSVMVAGLGT